jgi:hypothetical protein
MIASSNSAPARNINPISRWEDDGGPAPVASDAGRRIPRTVNVGGTERAISALAGGSLLAYGLSRRSLPGLLTAIVGGGLVYRGMTGYCTLYDALGVSTLEDTLRPGARAEGNSGTQSARTPSGVAVSSGPVEYRASATPPMHAPNAPPVVSSQTSEASNCPVPSAHVKNESEFGFIPAPSHQSMPSPQAPQAARQGEQSAGAEPQGRT